MAQLSPAELRKYDWRPSVLIEKIKTKSPLETTSGMATIIMPKNGEKILRNGTTEDLKNLRFADTTGKVYKLSDFVKNKDFGGKGAGSGVAKETIALNSLNTQLDSIKNQIGSAYVPIKHESKIYYIDRAEKTSGTPKSDFHLIDKNGKEVVWISHKDGKTAKDFQQWGGMSQRAEPKIYSHKESQAFINDLLTLFPNGLPNATTLARSIRDTRLQMMSAYGSNFGGAYGQQNVSLMLQGEVKVVKKGNAFAIEAYHTHNNGDALTNEYEPVFMAIYKGDRSDFGVKGTRIVIAPAGCRKVTNYV